MTDNEKAVDILHKLDFFYGQRAGRELWNEKPTDVQDKDIENFSKDVAFLKDFINRQKAEIERLEHIRADLSREADQIAEEYSNLVIEKDELFDIAEAQKTEIERLKSMNQSKLDIIHDIRADLETAKAEIVKEFAERLHKLIDTDWGKIHNHIDNLVKEFTEGKDENT
jgi:chromosome segregation ATPase